MTELQDRLKNALADRYLIERELGRGGMAVVYLARDVKHERQVAIKVLSPELAASLGAERFLREIQISAQLNHPNILTLIDSGEADGLLYYVMPLVEGESLRQRLSREKQLPIEDALQVTKEVADALGHAHSLGIVHRDIKPENVMLESGHAVVTDFGIARAVTEAGGEKLTETGIAVGTPAYMSPEQAMGVGEVDARSDVYALAVVLYEMLSGDPPFTGTTPQAILARKATEPPPGIKAVRRTISDPLELAVLKALETTPADRYQTVGQFVEALEGAASMRPSVRRQFQRARWWGTLRESWVWLTVVVALVSGGVVTWTALRNGPAAVVDYDLDQNLFAIAPFTASEGVTLPIAAIPQYMTAAVTGWDSVRVADVAETARQVALATEANGSDEPVPLQVARAQRAHRYIVGNVAQAGERVTVTASMYSGQDGSITAQADAHGPVDSLEHVAQMVLLQLLAVDEKSRISEGGPRWGLEEHRLEHVKGRRLEAVASYVRSIRETCCPPLSPEWGARAREAVRLDSSFALAAFEAFLGDEADRVLGERAWQLRGNLGLRDRAFIEAELKARHERVTVREQLELWEGARRLAPSDPFVSFEYAEELNAHGPIAGNTDWYVDFLDVFLNWVRERPHYMANMGTEVWAWTVAAFAGDSTWFPRYREAQRGVNADSIPVGLTRPYGRWAETAATGREWTITQLEAADPVWSPDSIDALGLGNIAMVAVFSGRGLADIERLAPALRRKNNYLAVLAIAQLHRERGEHGDWRALRDSLSQSLFLDTWGDTALAAHLRVIDLVTAHEPEPAVSLDSLDAIYSAWAWGGASPNAAAWCFGSQLRLARGSTTGVGEAIRELERLNDGDRNPIASACGPFLTLERAKIEGTPLTEPARRLGEILDDPLLPTGPFLTRRLYHYLIWQANLALARLWYEAGRPRRALGAVRRQQPQFNNFGYLVESLRLEAALLGELSDTAQALSVYDHYIKLRPERPEYEPWAATWDSVRAEYAALGGR